MKIRYETNLAAGIVGVGIGAVLWFLIPRQIGEDYATVYSVSSRTIPYGLVGVFIIGGCALIFNSVVRGKRVYKELEIKKELKALAFMVVLAVYAFAFSYNYIAATVALGVATLAFAGEKRRLYYAIVIALVVLLYLLFSVVLRVRLPV